MKERNYILSIWNENKRKRAKVIELKATTKNLEKMLKMIEKMKWAKSKMVGHIFDSNYNDIAFITNRNYYNHI